MGTRPFIDQFWHNEWIKQSLASKNIVCQYVIIPIVLFNVAYYLAALPFFMISALVYKKIGGDKLLVIGALLHFVGHTFHFGPELVLIFIGRAFIGAGVGTIILVRFMLFMIRNLHFNIFHRMILILII